MKELMDCLETGKLTSFDIITFNNGVNIKHGLTILIVLVLLFSINVYPGDKIFFNPGVKMGYAFGQGGGALWGIELSVTSLKEYGGMMYGGVISYDFGKHYDKFHIGFEMARGYGADIGPTFVIEDGELYTGFSVTPFIGILLMPYVSYTFIYSKYSNYEAGAFLKAPFKLKGERFSFGG